MAKKGRGSNTHGHGTHRRGKGRKGGKGFAGVYKQRWMSTIKGGKNNKRKGKFGHFGKVGFARGGLREDKNVVNINWVDQHFDKTGDLTKLGIDKLLGTGKITKPLTIKVSEASETAKKKIEAAGGKLELVPKKEIKSKKEKKQETKK